MAAAFVPFAAPLRLQRHSAPSTRSPRCPVVMTLSAPSGAEPVRLPKAAGADADAVVRGGLTPGVVHEVSTPEEFDALLDAAGPDGLVVADFLARWCRKCIYLKARLPKLALAYPNVYFATVDVNKVARLPREYKISKMPTFVFVRGDRSVLESYVGAAEAAEVKSQVIKLIEKYADRKAFGSMVELRYASQAKETGWLVRQNIVTRAIIRRTDNTPKRLFFKLRGAVLSAHPAETYPEHWRAAVVAVLNADAGAKSIAVRTEHATATLVADSDADFSRWLNALSATAGASFSKFYKRERYLAKGHFSVVYLASDRRTGERFAVKIIKKDKNDLNQARKFVRREVKVLSVTKHPNLLRAVDFFSVDGKPHLVLEYVDGGSLRDLIKRRGRLDAHHARIIMHGLLSGVAYLHGEGIVHRDLKPDNVLMATECHPKVADFGLATFLSEDSKQVHSVVGTPSYVAPEVMRGVAYGTPADCWALGIILYYMIVGERPYQGETREDIKKAVLEGTLRFPNDVLGPNQLELRHLISSLLSHDQRSRISAADALKHPWVQASQYAPPHPDATSATVL